MKINGWQCLLALSLSLCFNPHAIAQPIFYAEDYPIALPAYWQEGLRLGITGTLRLRLHFEESKVVRVEDVYSDLKSERAKEKHPTIVWSFINQVKHAYQQWFTYFGGSFSAEIETVFQIDPELGEEERIFRVTYGNDRGIISKVVVIGPDLRKEE